MPVLTDPVAAGQAQEQRPVEAARRAEVDILDGGGVAQFGGARPRLGSCPAAWCMSADPRLVRGGQAATPGSLTRGASLTEVRLSRLM